MKILINDKLQQYHISKNKLAKMLDISYPTLLDLCSGKATSIRMDTLEKLCNIFHCTPNDILIPDQQKLESTSVQFPSNTIIHNDDTDTIKKFLKRYYNLSSDKVNMEIEYDIRKDEQGNTVAFPYIIIDGYDEANHHNNSNNNSNNNHNHNDHSSEDDTK